MPPTQEEPAAAEEPGEAAWARVGTSIRYLTAGHATLTARKPFLVLRSFSLCCAAEAPAPEAEPEPPAPEEQPEAPAAPAPDAPAPEEQPKAQVQLTASRPHAALHPRPACGCYIPCPPSHR